MTELALAQREADRQNRSIWHHTGDKGGRWVHPQYSEKPTGPLNCYQAAKILVVEDGQNIMTVTLPIPRTLAEVKAYFHETCERLSEKGSEIAFHLRQGVITATII
jgi:hypothetical protein